MELFCAREITQIYMSQNYEKWVKATVMIVSNIKYLDL